MESSDNEKSLNRIMEMLRMMSLLILLLHFYFYCYTAFKAWHFYSDITDRLILNISRTGLFDTFNTTKYWSLGLLLLSLLGGKGRKIEKLRYYIPLVCLGLGLLFYFGSAAVLALSPGTVPAATGYMSLALAGYILLLTGGSLLSRILHLQLKKDIFNTLNESFPQEERLLESEYRVNLRTSYSFRGKVRKGWINANLFRGLLVMGLPGGGKSWFVIRPVIRQHIRKGYAMLVYDFKYDDLTRHAYNCYLRYRSRYVVKPRFCVISFDDPVHSHRCNPLAVSTMKDVTDAAESARTILLGLNTDWVDKQGDFWVESSIAFLTAIIWYLRRHQEGKYCTLPHVIELMQIEYDKLFSILRAEPEIRHYINPFVSSYLNKVMETLDNQISSLKIGLSRLSSPVLYYIMSGNELSLEINNPATPVILCIGNSPQRSGIYGAVISLYITTINRLINKKDGQPCSLVYDELPTVYVHQLHELMATGRSNKIAVTACVQDLNQLRVSYGKALADVIMNLPGNIISAQVNGDSAKYLSERIGRIMQERESLQQNRTDISISRSGHLDMAVPAAKIAQLSAGEFVGVVADDPDELVPLKAFHGRILQDNEALGKVEAHYKGLPVIRQLSETEIMDNYTQIRKDIAVLVTAELQRMMKTPELAELLIKGK